MVATDPTARETQVAETLAFEIELLPGDELRGSITRKDDARVLMFHGWVDFMAAMCVLRSP
jgi:hypothetical protein